MLSVLVLAAAVAAPPPAPAAVHAQPARVFTSVVSQPDRCKGGGLIEAAKLASPKAIRLGDLPKANSERAVLVRQNGCVKPQVVQYGAGK